MRAAFFLLRTNTPTVGVADRGPRRALSIPAPVARPLANGAVAAPRARSCGESSA